MVVHVQIYLHMYKWLKVPEEVKSSEGNNKRIKLIIQMQMSIYMYELCFLIKPDAHISKHSEMKGNAITDLHRSE